MVKGNSLPRPTFGSQEPTLDLSKIESRLSSLEKKLSENSSAESKALTLDVSSLPPLGSRKDNILNRVNAIEVKLEALIELLK